MDCCRFSLPSPSRLSSRNPKVSVEFQIEICIVNAANIENWYWNENWKTSVFVVLFGQSSLAWLNHSSNVASYERNKKGRASFDKTKSRCESNILFVSLSGNLHTRGSQWVQVACMLQNGKRALCIFYLTIKII